MISPIGQKRNRHRLLAIAVLLLAGVVIVGRATIIARHTADAGSAYQASPSSQAAPVRDIKVLSKRDMVFLTAMVARDAQGSFARTQKAVVSGQPTLTVEPAANNYYVGAAIPVIAIGGPRKPGVVQATRSYAAIKGRGGQWRLAPEGPWKVPA
ncbi:MAG: hypothetical protein ACYDAG_10205 [Chloroflexota bacterium]